MPRDTAKILILSHPPSLTFVTLRLKILERKLTGRGSSGGHILGGGYGFDTCKGVFAYSGLWAFKYFCRFHFFTDSSHRHLILASQDYLGMIESAILAALIPLWAYVDDLATKSHLVRADKERPPRLRLCKQK
ncbi:hypothetical protein H5410_050660 [Solanum commersonii]|uniref:Uncharacterized protein n=1 Tax=Solanum commersonii TaxID=4109 RepID=A0A9J5WW29_SOLCO|nr:hypothetical protein H5410_050660 [Solanum commersonii]